MEVNGQDSKFHSWKDNNMIMRADLNHNRQYPPSFPPPRDGFDEFQRPMYPPAGEIGQEFEGGAAVYGEQHHRHHERRSSVSSGSRSGEDDEDRHRRHHRHHRHRHHHHEGGSDGSGSDN